MVRKDYLENQIDEIGKVLTKIISDFFGFQNKGNQNINLAIVTKTLSEKLDLDLDQIIKIPNSEFVDFLIQNKKFSNQSLDKLSELLLILTDNVLDNKLNNNQLYQKCLILLEYLKNTEKDYSFDRHFKIEKLKAILNN
jgi:hypothetical protein